MTKGARDMLSTPPAMIRSASPALIARAASPTASRPEPHRRFTVTPVTVSGRPDEQRRHARDVAVVLARLVGAAEDHVVDRRRVDALVARDQRTDRQRRQVVGAHARERARVAADGGTHGITDEGFHDQPLALNRGSGGHGRPARKAASYIGARAGVVTRAVATDTAWLACTAGCPRKSPPRLWTLFREQLCSDAKPERQCVP